jgi:hypothetical protein
MLYDGSFHGTSYRIDMETSIFFRFELVDDLSDRVKDNDLR